MFAQLSVPNMPTASAQCDSTFSLGGNVNLCVGESMVLDAGPGYLTYLWSTGSTTQTITVTEPGSYSVQVQGIGTGTNLVVNSHFNQGVSGFYSNYQQGLWGQWGPLSNEGTYQVGSNPQTLHSNFQPCGDHTTGAGNMLVVNGSATPNINVWCQTVNVAPNTNYAFSAWLTSVHPDNPAVLQFKINGVPVGSPLQAAPGTCNWNQFYTLWNSGGSSSATLCITNQNTNASGNDFALDDITFSPLCTYTDSVTVDLISPMAPEITGPNQTCAGVPVTIATNDPNELLVWSNGAIGPNATVEAGTYTVTVSIGNCSATSDPFTVTELPSPIPVITGPDFACDGSAVTLSTTQPFDAYFWSTGATTPSVNVGIGDYTVTVINQFGCSGTSSPFGVSVANTPTALFAPAPPSPQLPGTTVFFQDGSQGNGGTISNWWWEFGAGGSTSIVPSPTVTFNEPGTYTITLVVTTTQGCTDTITYAYVIRPEEILIPNVFSPNNDGTNDAFTITNIQFHRNNLTIFNRWGDAVYEARNYTNQWRGADLPDGTYFYILKLDEGREFTGYVTLLR